jgi:hypothetical protein
MNFNSFLRFIFFCAHRFAFALVFWNVKAYLAFFRECERCFHMPLIDVTKGPGSVCFLIDTVAVADRKDLFVDHYGKFQCFYASKLNN